MLLANNNNIHNTVIMKIIHIIVCVCVCIGTALLCAHRRANANKSKCRAQIDFALAKSLNMCLSSTYAIQ